MVYFSTIRLTANKFQIPPGYPTCNLHCTRSEGAGYVYHNARARLSNPRMASGRVDLEFDLADLSGDLCMGNATALAAADHDERGAGTGWLCSADCPGQVGYRCGFFSPLIESQPPATCLEREAFTRVLICQQTPWEKIHFRTRRLFSLQIPPQKVMFSN